MTNPLRIALVAFVLSTLSFADAANAIAINQCIRLIRDAQGGRESIVNTCKVCMTAKVQRRRSGYSTGTPTLRKFNLQPGSQMTLPFRGPGLTRITGSSLCPSAR